MTAWTHTLHLLWVLALLVPRVGLGMPVDVGVPPDCPGHGYAAVSPQSAPAHHPAHHDEARHAGDQHTGDTGCSVDCLLSCALAGLQAGTPMAAAQGRLLPDTHPLPQLQARAPADRPGSLFRPPRP